MQRVNVHVSGGTNYEYPVLIFLRVRTFQRIPVSRHRLRTINSPHLTGLIAFWFAYFNTGRTTHILFCPGLNAFKSCPWTIFMKAFFLSYLP